jgi:hypothetical protein
MEGRCGEPIPADSAASREIKSHGEAGASPASAWPPAPAWLNGKAHRPRQQAIKQSIKQAMRKKSPSAEGLGNR